MSRLQALKGTRDFYPDRMRVRQWIEATWRETSERFGFQAYDAPVIEPLELYTRKSGEEIVEQLYAFRDKGGRDVALRPEMTPSLARMIAARSQGIPKPIKWYSIPRLFRYEQPQRGRLREFFQLNLDIVGVEGVEADAEIIAAGVEVLRAFGLTADDFVVRYSDRRLLDAVLTGLSIPEGNRATIYAALDRLSRDDEAAVIGKLGEAGVPEATARTLVEAIGRRDLAGLQEALVPTGVHLAPEVEPLVRRAGPQNTRRGAAPRASSTPTAWPTSPSSTPPSCAGSPTTRAWCSSSTTGPASCGRSAVAAGSTTWWRPPAARTCRRSASGSATRCCSSCSRSAGWRRICRPAATST